jgi:ATP-dependent DNA helicase RecG
LFSTNVAYKNLQLAVIDEQHRFGVAQREAIVAKGRVSSGPYSHSPDVLMMSATPIPQTLALTAFGDLDITTIRSMPTGRKGNF